MNSSQNSARNGGFLAGTSYELPDFNLQTELSTAATGMKTVATSFESEAAKRLRDRVKKHDELRERLEDELKDLEVEAAGLAGKRTELETRLNALGPGESDAHTKLKEGIAETAGAESAKYLEVAAQKAKLEALGQDV